MKNALMCALAIALIGAAGCAGQAPVPEAVAPAAPAAPPPPAGPEIRSYMQFNGPDVSIYHPDTRTLYLWSSTGDMLKPSSPRRTMSCVKVQIGDSPSGGPVTEEPCS